MTSSTTTTTPSPDPFLSAISSRRSRYALTNKSPISDSQIEEIIAFAIKHVPSPFNVQSARAVILLREQHEKLWDIGDRALQEELPPAGYTALAPKVAGLRGAYGSVCIHPNLYTYIDSGGGELGFYSVIFLIIDFANMQPKNIFADPMVRR
jgi:nitroreductase